MEKHMVDKTKDNGRNQCWASVYLCIEMDLVRTTISFDGHIFKLLILTLLKHEEINTMQMEARHGGNTEEHH